MLESYPHLRRVLMHFNVPDKTSSLGSGAFGVVLKGLVDGTPVAVKTLSRHAEKAHLKALLSELKIQIHLGTHPNLVRFIGASTKNLDKGI